MDSHWSLTLWSAHNTTFCPARALVRLMWLLPSALDANLPVFLLPYLMTSYSSLELGSHITSMKPFQFHPACVTHPFVWPPTSVCLCFIITFVQVCSVFYCVLFRFESHVFLPEGKNLWNLFLCAPEHTRQSGLHGHCRAQWKSLFRGRPAAQQTARYFRCIVTCAPADWFMSYRCDCDPFYRWENWSLERGCHLLRLSSCWAEGQTFALRAA